jgi:hypothetical protein
VADGAAASIAAAASIVALAWRTAATAFAAAACGLAHVLAIAPDIEAAIAPEPEGHIGSADVITAAFGTALDGAGMADGGGPMGSAAVGGRAP